jgi:ubiquinone/menaquinone biosynthesis C-methylase UbiE
VPDKRAALQEVARILKLGGRFVGTTWELRADSAALSAPAFDEYPSAFRDAGFPSKSTKRPEIGEAC